MTMFCARTAPAVGAKYYSSAQYVPYSRIPCPPRCVALLESPLDRLPRNQCSNVRRDTGPGCVPRVGGKSARSDPQLHKPRFVASGEIGQPTPKLCALSLRRTTRVHRVRAPYSQDRPGQAPLRSHSTPARRRLFFDPIADGVAGHPKSARQAAQRAALLISSQDDLAFGWCVSRRAWIFTARFAAVLAQVFLFPVRSVTIAYQVLAAAGQTFQRDPNHRVLRVIEMTSLEV
jgi:hypothetical protein